MASKPFPSFPLSLKIPTSIPSIAVGLGSNVDQQFLIGLVFGLSIIGAIIVREIVFDKQFHLYLQLEMMGCSPIVYWLANFVVDYIRLWLSFVPVYLICLAFQVQWLLNWKFGHFILFSSVMLLAFLLFQYVLSKAFNNADDSISTTTSLACRALAHCFLIQSSFLFATLCLLPFHISLFWFFKSFSSFRASTAPRRTLFSTFKTTLRSSILSYVWILKACTPFDSQVFSQTLFTAAIHEQMALPTEKGAADLFLWDAQGLRLFFLFVHIIIYVSILTFTNNGRAPTAIKHFVPPKPRPPMIRPNMQPEVVERLQKQYEMATKEPEYDPDVVAERQRLIGAEPQENGHSNGSLSSAAGGDLLRSAGLYKYYNSDIPAVQPMYVGVEGRSCFGLLGTNGAGKSTLIGMILGQLNPSGGKVAINHVPVYDTPRTQMYEASLLGACLQEDALWPYLTPREHIDLFLRMRNDLSHYSTEQIDALTQNILSQLRLSNHQHKQAEQLSGGNKRKLCSAIALLCGNKVVLLDECVLFPCICLASFLPDCHL